MFDVLEKINAKPEPFEFYTASELWTDEHTSEQMLLYHLNEDVDLSSRNAEFIDRSVQWIAAELGVEEGVSVADFGCGPGLYASRLARLGAVVTGIDFSKRSIDYAKDTALAGALSVNYVNENYLDFETQERFNLILMIMCDFCALSPTQRNAMLNKFRSILKPGGRVLLDVYSVAAFQEKEEVATYEENQLNGFWSPDKYYGFLNTFKYDKEMLSLDKYTIVESVRTREVYNWLQHFSPDDLAKEFASAGLAVERVYSDVAGADYSETSTEFAVVARKADDAVA